MLHRNVVYIGCNLGVKRRYVSLENQALSGRQSGADSAEVLPRKLGPRLAGTMSMEQNKCKNRLTDDLGNLYRIDINETL